VSFRERLLATLRALEPVLSVPGVLVVGSEVPNLMEPGGASTLVVSQDVDIAIPLSRHAEAKDRLRSVRGLAASTEEPSVWIPVSGAMLEANFLGMEPGEPKPGEAFVHEDSELPLLVFGNLGYLEPDVPRTIDEVRIPLPRAHGLALEKLLTDRSGEKYERDLLVVLGLVLTWTPANELELVAGLTRLPREHRWAARANLAALSLLADRPGMPRPTLHRERLHALVMRLEGALA
jgi:hypothetical protein